MTLITTFFLVSGLALLLATPCGAWQAHADLPIVASCVGVGVIAAVFQACAAD
jgi:hypothetical protein